MVTITGAFFPKICAVVMTTSALAQCCAITSRCFASCSGVSSPRVAVRGLAGLPQIDFDELRPERLHLLFDGRPRVEGFNPGAESLRRRDGLQPGDTDADDKNAHGLKRSAGVIIIGKMRSIVDGRGDDRDISGETGLRTEHVHFLGHRDAGQHLEANRADATRGQRAHHFALIERVEQTDMDAARLEQTDFIQRGLRTRSTTSAERNASCRSALT